MPLSRQYYQTQSSQTMANYQPATSAEALWDPIETLQLVNPDRDKITCVGFAPSQGRRCRNPIAGHNISAAMQILNQFSLQVPDTEAMKPQLLEVASRLLCVRFHRNQREEVVRDAWIPSLEKIHLVCVLNRIKRTLDRMDARRDRAIASTPVLSEPVPAVATIAPPAAGQSTLR